MKKFSLNLLKVSLLSILGLCMIGMATEVNADVGSLKRIKIDGEKTEISGLHFVNRGYSQKVEEILCEGKPYNNNAEIANTSMIGNEQLIDARRCAGTVKGVGGPFYFKHLSSDNVYAAFLVDMKLGLADYDYFELYGKSDKTYKYDYHGAYRYRFLDSSKSLGSDFKLKLDYNNGKTLNGGAAIKKTMENGSTDGMGIKDIFGLSRWYFNDNDIEAKYYVNWVQDQNGSVLNNKNDYVTITNDSKLRINKANVNKYFEDNEDKKYIVMRVTLDTKVLARTSTLPDGKAFTADSKEAITSNVKTGFDVFIYNSNLYNSHFEFVKQQSSTQQPTTNEVTFTLDYNGGVNVNNKTSESITDTDGSITILDYSRKISNAGHNLIGWSKNKDATTADYEIGDKLTIKEGETLYAVWEKTEAKEPAKEPVKLQDANGTEFTVGDYVKYTDNTNEGGWNLRKTARGKILGEIKTGTMLEVTEVSTTDICIKVKVLDGDLEGKEGWLTISAKKNFEIIADYTPEEGEEGEELVEKLEIDLGNFKGIFEIIWNLVKILIENLPTIIEKTSPLVETGLTAIGGLVSGLMQ
ncbi:MAG: hypothetical protein IJN50_06935 [Clostridia bacterium]|nr:hypothetical protein [Clostridia bacterium]